MPSKKSASQSTSTAVNQKKENSMEQNFVENYDSQERLVSITVNPDAEQSFAIGTNGQEEMENGKSALRAAVDFYRFKEYNHKLTTVGLHFYANANLKAFMATNVGVINAQYDGDLPIPHPESGWAQVNLRNGRFYITKFNKEYAELRERKHDFVDAFIMGYGVDIRCLPWNMGNGDYKGLATTLMNTWKETDDKVANALRIDGYKRATAKAYVNKDIRKASRTGADLNVMTGDISGAMILSMDTGSLVLVDDLPMGRYKVYEDGVALTTINWDGSVYAASQLKRAANKTNWGFKAL